MATRTKAPRAAAAPEPSTTPLPDPATTPPLPHRTGAAREVGQLIAVGVALVDPSPYQPRRIFDEQELRALADDLARNGLLQPIVVRRVGARYELIAGERRWRAATLAGWPAVPALVREVSDAEAAVLALVENLKRRDLTPLEEAQAFRDAMAKHGWSQAQLAEQLGVPRSTVGDRVRMLELPAPWLDVLVKGEIQASHAPILHRYRELPDSVHTFVLKTYRDSWAVKDAKAERRPVSVEEFEDEVRGTYEEQLHPLGAGSPLGPCEIDADAYTGAVVTLALPAQKGKPGKPMRYACEPKKWQPLVDAARAKRGRGAGGRTAAAPEKKPAAKVPKHMELPKDVKSVEWPGYNALKGADWLVKDGRWNPREAQVRGPWDPEDLLAEGFFTPKLRLVTGSAKDAIATTDDAMMRRAREAWVARWRARRGELAAERGVLLERALRRERLHAVAGGGARALVRMLAGPFKQEVVDVAQAFGVVIDPDLVHAVLEEPYRANLIAWLDALTPSDAERVAAGIAATHALKLPKLSAVIVAEKEVRFAEIGNLKTPWLPEPAAKPVPTVDAVLRRLDRDARSTFDDPDESGDEGDAAEESGAPEVPVGITGGGDVAMCIVCGCTDDDACRPVTCHWLAVDYERGLGVCSTCAPTIAEGQAKLDAYAVTVTPEGAARE